MSLRLKDILRLKLKEKGIGLPTLSKKTGISRKTLANWVDGQKPQNIEQVKIIAEYFETTVDELCFGPTLIPQKSMNELERHHEEINAGIFKLYLEKLKVNEAHL